ncbi:hypothetical protein TNCV_2627631 [Trichonephila clavipes]|uniref:Uncharacterized protein n=1 Tax=Trichonephila clavipes TaxID=2585209 RepID=A0A8X6W7A9_TRICX|nr:hypothetical protein TNCV_2627631 [Trichonephila clavipes]
MPAGQVPPRASSLVAVVRNGNWYSFFRRLRGIPFSNTPQDGPPGKKTEDKRFKDSYKPNSEQQTPKIFLMR